MKIYQGLLFIVTIVAQLISPLHLRAQYTFTKIVDLNTSIPAGNGTFTNLFAPRISGGAITFFGQGADGQEGIYLQSTNLSRVVDLNTIVPGTSSKFARFYFYIYDGFPIDGSNVFFKGGNPERTGIYKKGPSGLERVVDTTMAIPGGFGLFVDLYTPAPSNGKVAFVGYGDTNYTGAFMVEGTNITRLFDSTTPFPNGTGNLILGRLAHDNGQVLMYASDSASYKSAILTWADGTLRQLITNNTPLPGSSNTILGSMSYLALGEGNLVFVADFLHAGERSGICMTPATTNSPSLIVEAAPINFYGHDTDNGSVVFSQAKWDSPGTYNPIGMYLWKNGMISPIVTSEIPFDGKIISSPIQLQQGCFNDGEVVFKVDFTDNTQAIYKAVVVPPAAKFDPQSIQISTNGLSLTFMGPPGQSFRIETTSNWLSWDTLTNVTGTATVNDPAANGAVPRFYRAVSP